MHCAPSRTRSASRAAYLLGGEADAIISIADATCPARSLYLTLQLLELGVPVVLALNVMDALRAGGGAVDTAGLAQALGIPVVPVSAALGEGLDTLLDAAVQRSAGCAARSVARAGRRAPVQGCVRTLARVLCRRGCARGGTAADASRRRSGSTAATRLTTRRRRHEQAVGAHGARDRAHARRGAAHGTLCAGGQADAVFHPAADAARAAGAARASTACSRGGIRPTPRWWRCSAACST